MVAIPYHFLLLLVRRGLVGRHLIYLEYMRVVTVKSEPMNRHV